MVGASAAAAVLLIVAPLVVAGCQAAPRCEAAAPRCQEWVVVVRAPGDVPTATAWLAAQGWAVGPVLPRQNLVRVWLPRGDAGRMAVQRIRAQSFVAHVSDQVEPRPGGD